MILDESDPPDIEWNDNLDDKFFKGARDYKADPGEQYITSRDRLDRVGDEAFRKLIKLSDHRGRQLRGPSDLAHVSIDQYLVWANSPEYLKSSSRSKIKQFAQTRTEDRHSPIDNPCDDRLMSDEERSARAIWIMRNCRSPETNEGKLSIADIQRFTRPYRQKRLTDYAVKQATKLADEFMATDVNGGPCFKDEKTQLEPGPIKLSRFARVEPMIPPGSVLDPVGVCQHVDLVGRRHCPYCDHIAAENRKPSQPALWMRSLREKLAAASHDDRQEALDMVRLAQALNLSFDSQQRKTFVAPLVPVQGDRGLVPIRFEAGLPVFADRDLKHVIEIAREWDARHIRDIVALSRNLFLISRDPVERPEWYRSVWQPIEPIELCECDPDAIANGAPFGTTASYPCPLCKARAAFMFCHQPSHRFGCMRCNLVFSVTYCEWIDELIDKHIQRPIPGSGTNDPIAYLDRQKPQQS